VWVIFRFQSAIVNQQSTIGLSLRHHGQYQGRGVFRIVQDGVVRLYHSGSMRLIFSGV